VTHSSLSWQVRDRAVDLALRPLILGIVNVTPDSFSDGGQFLLTKPQLLMRWA